MKSQVEVRDTAPITVSLGGALRGVAQERGGRIAVTITEDSIDYATLHARSNRLARALARRGVGNGDLVTVALPTGVAFVEACYAAWKLGATPNPVSHRLPRHELDAIVALARPSAVVADKNLVSGALWPTTLLAKEHDDSDLPDRIAPSLKAPTSGGSTGRPKLIVSTTPGIVDPHAAGFWRMSARDVVFTPAPLHHNAPFSVANAALSIGATLVLSPRFDAEATLAEIERLRVTWIYLVPTMMRRILDLPKAVRERYDVSSLHTLWHMAAPCPPDVKRAFIDWLGGDTVLELYGGTESQAMTAISGTEWLERPGSVGRAVVGEIAVLDENGMALPAGTVGQLYLRRGSGAPASYRYLGAEAEAIGDWETLGDMGHLDADGFLYLADRRSDMILVGGANVYPAEVEAALESDKQIASAAVVGLPDRDMGCRIHAIVEADGMLDLDALAETLTSRLAPDKWPRTIEVTDTPLRDDAGKVRRPALRDARLIEPIVLRRVRKLEQITFQNLR